MKKSIVLVFVLFSYFYGFAESVDLSKAHKIAEQILGKPCTTHKETLRRTHSPKAPAYYMFSGDENQGFVIVSGESDMEPVLAYSKSASSSVMPDALMEYLATYEKYIEAYRNGNADSPEDIAGVFSERRAAGVVLLESSWGQGKPYNNLCPVLQNKQCPTGCVATATAQILYYWKWPVQGQGYGSATDTDGVVYHGTLEHTYAWGNMLNTWAENDASPAAATAVAELLYDCGLAVGMTYGVESSGAGTPKGALYKNFGYVPTTLRTQMRECFETEKDFLRVIADEIDEQRPVYMSASSASGSGADAAGHAFVIAGYNTSGQVYVNWGWDGNYDGYYNLSLMNPSGYTFTIEQKIITGIIPAKNGETGLPIEFPYMSAAPSCSQSVGQSIASSVEFKINIDGRVCNVGSLDHTWSMTIGLYDVKNEFKKEVKTSRIPTSFILEPDHYYPENTFSFNCKLGTNIADGDYALRVAFKEGNISWFLPDVAGGMKNNAVYIKVKDKNITFTDGTDYIEAYKETTGITTPSVTRTASSHFYDLLGCGVKTPTRGLYISNGKKVVVK